MRSAAGHLLRRMRAAARRGALLPGRVRLLPHRAPSAIAVCGGVAIAGWCLLARQQALAERVFSIDDATEEISRRINELREDSKNAKWPKLLIRKYRDGNQMRYIFEFSYDQTASIERIIDAITTNVGKPMQVLPSSQQNTVCLSLDGAFQVIILTSSKKIFFEKNGSHFHQGEVDAVTNTYQICNQNVGKTNEELTALNLRVYTTDSKTRPTWDDIAGYEGVKDEIQSTVINALKHPEIYENIASQTRRRKESNQPKAILFEGPPGTGKTTAARIIAAEIDVPMVYVPIESIMSMYYGESEKMLAKVFDTCEKVGRSIIFLDEIDSLATSRGRDMHEATRRILSTLLRRIEGFDRNSGVIIIGATNRKQDLDDAMLSRFDISLKFSLPGAGEREKIFQLYAKQLPQNELQRLGQQSEGLSGRDIRDLCAHAERSWGTSLIQEMNKTGGKPAGKLTAPPFSQYMKSLGQRKSSIQKGSTQKSQNEPVICSSKFEF